MPACVRLAHGDLGAGARLCRMLPRVGVLYAAFGFAGGGLSPCKRPCFRLQYAVFCRLKGGILESD